MATQPGPVAGEVERGGVAPAAIDVRGVAKAYGAGRKQRVVVDDCSFRLERNQLTVMIGPSGVGKSTLVRLIAGFERPTRGEIFCDGRIVERPSKDRLVVFQETALFPWMTTTANVLYGPDARGEPAEGARRATARLIERVGLRAFGDRYPSQLSGGMQRRAELARALVNSPRVMILDEPFRGLDALTKQMMLEYYAGLAEQAGRTDLFVTTDIDEAIFLADRLLIMAARPTRVRAVLEVDLPRPRTVASVANDERASRLKVEALAILHEEAMKAFASGSSASADFVEAYRARAGTPV